MTDLIHLKFLTCEGKGPYSDFVWPMGEWVEVEGPLSMCRNGIHVCSLDGALDWLEARCHPVEIRGEQLHGYNKLCVRAARLGPPLPTWNEQTQRLFAADCAERVLPLWEREHPKDLRPREVIEMARRFARREASWDAAWAAAMDAARDAAWAAAARGAAWAAAWDDERKWQAQHLATILRGELYGEFTG